MRSWNGVVAVLTLALAGAVACATASSPEPVECIWWSPSGPGGEERLHCYMDNVDGALQDKVYESIEIEAKREAGISETEIQYEHGEPKTHVPVWIQLESANNYRALTAWLDANTGRYRDRRESGSMYAVVEISKLMELSRVDGVGYLRRQIQTFDLVGPPIRPTGTPTLEPPVQCHTHCARLWENSRCDRRLRPVIYREHCHSASHPEHNEGDHEVEHDHVYYATQTPLPTPTPDWRREDP